MQIPPTYICPGQVHVTLDLPRSSPSSSDEHFENALEREENRGSGAVVQSSSGSKGEVRQTLQETFLDGAGADGVVTADELKAFYQKHAGESKQILSETMASLGIPRSSKLSVTTNEYGKICVSGNISEEDRQRLEESLNDNPAFRHSYSAAASTATLLEAIKHHMEFAKAYEKSPKEAVARFSWLFDADWRCELNYDDGEMDFAVSCPAFL